MRISRLTSTQIKGIAIIMMIFHHLFSYPDWWKTSFSPVLYSFIPLEYIVVFGQCMKMCIPVYAFITGYGLSCSYAGKKVTDIYKWTIRKLISLLLNYWLILGAVVLMLFFCGRLDINVKGFVGNLFGLGELIIPFAWYISFYIIILLVFPLLYCGIAKKLVGKKLLVMFAGYTVVSYLLFYCVGRLPLHRVLSETLVDYSIYSPFVVAGGSLGLVKKSVTLGISESKKKILAVVLIVLSVGVKMMLRASTKLDIIIVPCIVISLACILPQQKVGIVSRLFSYLGKHSFNFWLLHCLPFVAALPCVSTIQNIVYFPRIPILIVCWTVILMLPFSHAVNWGMKSIEKCCRKSI